MFADPLHRFAGATLRARARAVPRNKAGADDGFTLIELLVSMIIIGIIMVALASFFVSTVSATAAQGVSQVGIQLADDGVERVSAIKGSALVLGRDKTSSDLQWANPVAGVSKYLSGMTEAYDSTAAANLGASAALPTVPVATTLGGRVYNQNFYLGTCYQPASGGICGTSSTTGVLLYRVILAVTWSNKGCLSSACSYITSTLVSGNNSEPVFNSNQSAQPPAVTNPGPQASDQKLITPLQLTATGGAGTVTWASTTLPPGLAISTSGLITGTPSTASVYSVTVTATDGFTLAGSSSFKWTVNSAPGLTPPGTQTTMIGTPATLSPSLSGGTAPYSWIASGLPNSLSIDPTSGVISGTPTKRGTSTVSVTVTDAFGLTAAETFSWVIMSASSLSITYPTTSAMNFSQGQTVSGIQCTATGGTGTGLTWSATGLPAGITITSAGVISGTAAKKSGSTSVIVQVTDSAGGLDSVAFQWNVV